MSEVFFFKKFIKGQSKTDFIILLFGSESF